MISTWRPTVLSSAPVFFTKIILDFYTAFPWLSLHSHSWRCLLTNPMRHIFSPGYPHRRKSYKATACLCKRSSHHYSIIFHACIYLLHRMVAINLWRFFIYIHSKIQLDNSVFYHNNSIQMNTHGTWCFLNKLIFAFERTIYLQQYGTMLRALG